MRLVTCLLLALGSGLAGLALRMIVPVTPVDAPFREVIRLHRVVPDDGSGTTR